MTEEGPLGLWVTGSRERCNRKIHGTNAACAYYASGASTALQHRPGEAPRKPPTPPMALDRHSAADFRGDFLSPVVQERPSAGGAWTGSAAHLQRDRYPDGGHGKKRGHWHLPQVHWHGYADLH